MRRRQGERFRDQCVQDQERWGTCSSIMVLGSISYHSKTPLNIIDGTLIAQRYISEILEPTVQHSQIRYFQQDNARPHTARVTREILAEQEVNILAWPASLS